MNYNQECMFLKKRLNKRPFEGKRFKEIQIKYVCTNKKKLMCNNGCPQPNVCKGYKQTGIRVMHYLNH